ncbi:exosortase/archaeosortase family protein [Akkermansiaceae bacterium]|nr:exosortase/archaeosortase family protein [Akkermansiaceae bacterium]MDB4537465.1 exosortase/archaeosortase family protein [Akkermansiaceae bacterium]
MWGSRSQWPGIAMIAALGFAFFPVMRWYVDRLDGGFGEFMGLIPLALVAVFGWKNAGRANYMAAVGFLILYVLGFSFLPPLIRAIPALLTIAFLTGIHRRPGLVALLLLSLPVQASLDFFLGYPFRIVTAEGSQWILGLAGFPVTRVGVQLMIKDAMVAVDPPCSGLQMLWVTFVLTAILATIFRLGWIRLGLLGITGVFLCLLGNTVRATILFFPESGMIALPGVAHVGIGGLIFLVAASVLVAVARKLDPGTHVVREPGRPVPPLCPLAALVSGIVVVAAPAISLPRGEAMPALTHYRGQPLEVIPLTDFEKRFEKTFPGQFGVYQMGESTLIVRHVSRASRRLHPSAHCLQGEGFQVGPATMVTDEDGCRWSRYTATRFRTTLSVSERIHSLKEEREWTEVSAWYWYALFHPQAGPWQAETIITPIETP